MTKLCTVSARKIDKYSGRKIYAGQCEKCLLEYSSYLFLFHHTNFHDIYIKNCVPHSFSFVSKIARSWNNIGLI